MMKQFELLTKAKPNSTVLQSFYWLLAFSCATIAICVWKESSSYTLYVSLGVFVFLSIAFVVVYFICLFKNPDLLRSENYNINKLEIENNIKQNNSSKHNQAKCE